VIGPNGAGKSTLFNVVSGLHAPSAGTVRFCGEDITGLPPEGVNRRGRPKTFQITNIFPEISVLDNVRVAAEPRAPESAPPAWPCCTSARRSPRARRRPSATIPASSRPISAAGTTDVFCMREVHAGYGATPILFGVSLEVRQGEAVALLGKNGMGKTTLMKTAIGFLKPWRGAIEFEGRDLTRLAPHDIARLGVGLVPENRRIFPGLTVRENLELGLSAAPRRSAALREAR